MSHAGGRWGLLWLSSLVIGKLYELDGMGKEGVRRGSAGGRMWL